MPKTTLSSGITDKFNQSTTVFKEPLKFITMLHELKTWPIYFREVKSGAKPFEVRKKDKGIQVGDEVLLREYCPDNYFEEGEKAHYTGQILHRKISYVLKGGQFGIDEDTVILGLQVV